jgi:hypothetical protein
VRMIPEKQEEKIEIPFSDIEVIDARYDRSYCGVLLFETDQRNAEVSKLEISFPDSLNSYLPRILERLVALNEDNPDRLLILIKRFRMADYNNNLYQPGPYLVLNCSFSFFAAQGDRYYRIGSFDKILSEKLEFSKTKDAEKIKTEALATMLEKIFRNRSWQKTNSSFTLNDIQKGVQQRYDLPIFKQELKPGCYTSFKEFVNNKPSITNITPVIEKNKLIGFKGQDGKLLDPAGFWGASDGNHAYIVFENSFNLLIPQDNAFRFNNKRSIENIPGVMKNKIYKTEKPELFHVNMDDGTVYMEETYGTMEDKIK